MQALADVHPLHVSRGARNWATLRRSWVVGVAIATITNILYLTRDVKWPVPYTLYTPMKEMFFIIGLRKKFLCILLVDDFKIA